MKKQPIQIKSFGDKAILIEWPSTIDKHVFETIVAFKNSLIHDEICDLIIAYNSLTITFFTKVDFTTWEIYLQRKYHQLKTNRSSTPNIWRIPVCFDAEFSIDLEHFAEVKNCTQATIIEMYCATIFTLNFYGFQPGFPYLSNLPKKLATPRKELPQKVLAGSVAIGGEQSGIYPANSLGGWHVLGNTPIKFFNPKSNPPCLIDVGANIQFYSITLPEFQSIKGKIDAETFDFNTLKG